MTVSNSELYACCVCQEPAQRMIICDSCALRLPKVVDMVPEQLLMDAQGAEDACLVDHWGRVYQLSERTEIGREPVGFGVRIHQGSVSRKHASLQRQGNGDFSLRDLKSTNGSFVGNERTIDARLLKAGDVVVFGSVGFYFVSPIPQPRETGLKMPTLAIKQQANTPVQSVQFDYEEDTSVGAPEQVEIRLTEATGGGGGFVRVEGNEVQVSMVQMELLRLLMRRMATDRTRPSAVRGYVHSSEILAGISWDTARPSDNHVKQLVRRLRRSLARSGRDNLIESQQGLGYRLSVLPS